jgi:hypothetical protein
MKNPDALQIFSPKFFGRKYKSLKKQHGGFPTEVSDMARNMKMDLLTHLSYTVSVEKLWTQNTRIIHSFVSRSNYIILDGSARTITLGFLRMEYLQ